MKEQILILVTAIIAGMAVMILHELPKSILYNFCNKGQTKKTKRNIYKLFQYVDPIGLILCVTARAGFSKPYMYRIKEKKTNFLLGMMGFISLAVIFAFSMILLRSGLVPVPKTSYTTIIEFVGQAFPRYFFENLGIISIDMFLVNLIPVSTFDLGLLIAGKSPSKYFSIIRNDFIIKMILLLVIIFDLISAIGINAVEFLLTI